MELQHCWAVLKPGGILFGDDWALKEVAEDVLKFVEMLLYSDVVEDVDGGREAVLFGGDSTAGAGVGGAVNAMPMPTVKSRRNSTASTLRAQSRSQSRSSKRLLVDYDALEVDLDWFPHAFYKNRVTMLRPGLFVSRDTFQWFLKKKDRVESNRRRLERRFEFLPSATYEAPSTTVDKLSVKQGGVARRYQWLDVDTMQLASEESPAFNTEQLSAPLRPHILGAFLESDELRDDPVLRGALPKTAFLNLKMKTCFLGLDARRVAQWMEDCCSDWSEENHNCWDLLYNPNHCCRSWFLEEGDGAEVGGGAEDFQGMKERGGRKIHDSLRNLPFVNVVLSSERMR
eukprot:g16601.t1